MAGDKDEAVPGGNTEDRLVATQNDDSVTTAENVDINAQIDEQRAAMQPSKLESFFAITKSLIIRALIVYFITSMFRQPAAPKPDLKSPTGAPRIPAINMFNNGSVLDMYCYISEKEYIDNFEHSELTWKHTDLIYGDWTGGPEGDGTFTHAAEIIPSESLRNNGSIYLHIYILESGKSPNPKDKNFAGPYITYGKKQLNKFKKLKYQKTHNLLTGETDKSEEEKRKAEIMTEEIVSHWHPNLTINLVTDQTNWLEGSVPPPLDEFIMFVPDGSKYKPAVFCNDYWNMMRDYVPINKTTTALQLLLTYQPLSLFKWQLYTAQAMRDKLSMFSALGNEEQDEDQDTVKELLLDTSPYLLGLTISISILHSIFELLAFKNDIQFWNNRQSLEGLSVRSVFFNVFQSTIVLLYVLDNETNVMVRISCFIGLLIEIWKINKVMDVKFNREEKVLGIFPKISLTDKGSYVESSTRQYDMMAFRYLSWACFPLLLGYGVYSLLYNEHKGWYSFILNMCYGYLLTFGFIMMTPQLFINYKMKSVAHLPWRMMTYKFLNTFIDDIFAFVIKMPTMYRLGCFRDDIVFFIFLYQRWIYKVDHKRVNEFGFSGEMEEQQKAGKAGALAPAPAAPAITSAAEPADKKND